MDLFIQKFILYNIKHVFVAILTYSVSFFHYNLEIYNYNYNFSQRTFLFWLLPKSLHPHYTF